MKSLLVLSLLLFLSISQEQSEQYLSLSKTVEINPSALDVMINSFDDVVVYFHKKTTQEQLKPMLSQLQTTKMLIGLRHPQDHTLFGYVNLTEDYQQTLQRFGQQEGFIVLNLFTQQFTTRTQSYLDLLQQYENIAHPRLNLKYQTDVFKIGTKTPKIQTKNFLLFRFNNSVDLEEYNAIYKKTKFYLQDLQISSFAVPTNNNEKSSICLYDSQGEIKDSYYFKNMTVSQKAAELLQQINIETLPFVSKLTDKNLHRVFGGSITDQLILLYKKQAKEEDIQSVRKVFSQAARQNKEHQLAFQRVIFCQMTDSFFEEQFNEEAINLFKESNGNNQDYVVMMTRTDYDRFNLKKYILKQNDTDLTSQSILDFIQDVRMKRLDPQYLSEKAPSEEENKGPLRKIVGSTFIKEIYEKPDQSIIVLFIDSKDQQSYQEAFKTLSEVARLHHKNFDGKLTFGVFDLAKNEHKLLYLKEAPQIVLFDRANKKQSKYFKIHNGISVEALEQWIDREVSNVEIVKIAGEL